MIDYCRESDRAAILTLWSGFDRAHLTLSDYYFREPTHQERELRHRKYLEEDNSLYLVARFQERVVGFLCGKYRSTPTACLMRERQLLEIHGVFVQQEQRSKGIAKKLLERALFEAKEREMDDLEIFTWDFNDSLNRSLSQMGFTRLSGKYGVTLNG